MIKFILVNPNIIKAGDTITIMDQGGTNKIQFVQGVEIVESILWQMRHN